MLYDMTRPCDACPFLKKFSRGFSMKRLREFASGEFPCHKTAEVREGDDEPSGYVAKPDSHHCAGALLFNERRGTPHQMARICERLGVFDPDKLDMDADVR